MDHLPWLLDRSADAPGEREPCGHALMASCPPEPFGDLNADIPFGFAHGAAATTTTNNNNTNAATNGSGPSAGNNAAGAPGVDGADSGVVGSSGNKGRTWELSKGDLTTLLDLSKKLDLDGEITPVMAWGMILSHPRLTDMTRDDIDNVIDNLNSKVRCYGFGAVMEEFEVRDAVNAVLSAKPEVGMVY
ncbi:hypothetical protein GGR56DRAFT_670215 [Xylariaceae sp. FL0804]|nr:hypothetical protein GGR56DRAFT_670215 [Xylariaceae sp. FL0804]